MNQIIAPSILSADFANLKNEIDMVNESKAEWIHLDVMDGVFVPNISFGIPIIQSIRKHTSKFLDVHLMIVEPERHINAFANIQVNLLTVHLEACNHLHRVIKSIKKHNIQAGVALNPHTPVNLLNDIIQELDLILLMSVNPGFGGQKFIEQTYKKTEELKNLLLKKNHNALIEIDGGITDKQAHKLFNLGANILVSGSFIFKSEHPHETIDNLLFIEK